MIRRFSILLVALVACGSEPPAYVPPPKLPPCPRAIGSVYHPGETAAAPSAPAPKPAEANSANSGSHDVMTVAMSGSHETTTHAREAYKPAVRPAPATAPDTGCGDKKKPCPLQRWMRERVATAVTANDAPALAKALDQMAKFSPSPAWQWNAMSAAAAEAARKGDMTEARKSCQGCHNAYKAEYRAKFRTRPAP
jgi:hypothetical protein